MREEDFKNAIAAQLRSWGFQVELIDEAAGRKSPDFLVLKGHERFIIELKSKGDDPDLLASEERRLREEGLSEHSETVERTNTVSGIVRDAVEQLGAHPAEAKDLFLIWFLALGRYAEAKRRQIYNSLYGSRNIFDLDNEGPMKPCYFFDFSDFFRFGDQLDGVILWADEEMRLLLNPSSSRLGALRASALAGVFGTAIEDPAELEREGNAYIADCDSDRKDKEAVLKYLREKYGLDKITDLGMGLTEVAVAIDGDWHSNT